MFGWATEPAIVIRRHADSEEEDQGLICIEVIATNGTFGLRTEPFYCGRQSLERFGAALSSFPAGQADRPHFVRGAEDAADQPLFLSMAAYVFGVSTALRLRFRDRGYSKAFDGMTEFSIQAETAAINRLGSLVERFSKLKHSDLRWTPSSGDLFVEPQADITS
jgi:hypothetical protein